MKSSLLVSVIVPTKNSISTIEKNLQSIRNQSYPQIELIVVDNHSTDATVHIARQYADAVYTRGPERSAQRNFGAGKSRGVYVYFPDSDMIIGKDVVRECVSLIRQDETIKAVIIPECTKGKGIWAAAKSLEREFYEGDESMEAARFFERVTFDGLQGYDEAITGPEDWDLPQRLGQRYRIGRIQSRVVHDEGEVSLWQLLKKKYYYGRRLRHYMIKHSATVILPQVAYFLRPAFYRRFHLFLRNPAHSVALCIMLVLEQTAGFLGYLRGSEK